MSKKGQVTVFVILGIVVIIVLALLFIGKDTLYDIGSKQINVEKKLETELNSIENQIEECITKDTGEFLQKIAKQGGYVEPTKYISYYGDKVSYLCQNIPDKKECLNSMLLPEDIENQLNVYLEERLVSCVGIEGFKSRNQELTTGQLRIVSKVHKENIEIKINWPIEISKDGLKVTKKESNYLIRSQLGNILEIVNRILNHEAQVGMFGTTVEIISTYGRHIVTIKQSNPHKIYQVSVIEEPNYVFQFGVESE